MRYRVRAELWGILAMRRIKLQTLAAHTPNCQQWTNRVYHEPWRTVSEVWARAVSDYLQVPMSLIVDPAPLPERTGTVSELVA